MLPLAHVSDPIIKKPYKQTHDILYQSDPLHSLSCLFSLSLFLGDILVAEAWCGNKTIAILALTQQRLIPEGNSKIHVF